MFNLLSDQWLPVLGTKTGRRLISPAELTSDIETDPIRAVAWPRADFRITTLELLVGLLATTCPPYDHDEWLDWWEAPPDAAALNSRFKPFAHAFMLDGDGSRFMQDREDLVSEAEPIERLLIEAPGASTSSKNTDLFVRRGRVALLGRAAAAIALTTFQSWAPSGGAGNRTGLRGGGPLVTLSLPRRRRTLWHLLWANVPCGSVPTFADLPLVFPWLASTVTSKTGATVIPDGAHPLRCWWGMPRRIRLDFVSSTSPLRCDLTGMPDEVAISTWRQRPHGANYAQWGGQHPLTPSYQLKAGTEVLPMHPQPGGVGYRHWVGLVLSDATGLRRPAPSITTWYGMRARDAGERDARLLAAGFDMDNMKARGFVESEMPLPAALDQTTQARVDHLSRRLVGATEQVANLVRSTVRQALFSAGSTVKLDSELISAVRERVWSQTEGAFFDALEREARRPAGSEQSVETKAWQVLLRDVALRLFDEAAPMDPDNVPVVRAGETVPRLIRARRNLLYALQGFGKEGTSLFERLELPTAEPKAVRRGKAA